MAINKTLKYLKEEVSIAPLVIFRIAFGALMFISVLRFILKGWVHNMYVLPKVYFPFFGFDWIKPLPETGMYLVFGILLVASLGIMIGAFYRLCTILFFFLFTYIELIDKTNYLNHYYFVSLVSFIMMFVPAGKNFSFDNLISRRGEQDRIPRFYIFLLQLQMFVVYFFAGVAKINADWLLEAQPLKTWLPAFSHFPIIGGFMEMEAVAYFFCWFGCIYDLLIGFFLFNRRTVNVAYFFVVVFHLATALFFNIGMFPFIMMTITIIFFKEEFHVKLLNRLKALISYHRASSVMTMNLKPARLVMGIFAVYFMVQALLPFRYLLYPGKLFWTEQGYRFSWRVMLMEKAGTAFFYVSDKKTGKHCEIDNKDYLTYMQEKMMATQPDMMVDYAKFLKEEYKKRGYLDPEVKAQSYVTVNGCGSREFIDPNVDLSCQNNSVFASKSWVKSY